MRSRFLLRVTNKRALCNPRPSFQNSQAYQSSPRTVLILSGLFGCGTHGYFKPTPRK